MTDTRGIALSFWEFYFGILTILMIIEHGKYHLRSRGTWHWAL